MEANGSGRALHASVRIIEKAVGAPCGMNSAPMSASTMSSMLPVSKPRALRPSKCFRSANLRDRLMNYSHTTSTMYMCDTRHPCHAPVGIDDLVTPYAECYHE